MVSIFNKKEKLEMLIQKVDRLTDQVHSAQCSQYDLKPTVDLIKLLLKCLDYLELDKSEITFEKREELKTKGYQYLGDLYNGYTEVWMKK